MVLMIGETSTTTILGICRRLVNYSTFFQIVLCDTCQFGRAIGRLFLEGNLRVLKKKKMFCKVFGDFKFPIDS